MVLGEGDGLAIGEPEAIDRLNTLVEDVANA